MEYTYYGRNDGTPPTLGFEYMLLDEHVQKILDKQTELFDKQSTEIKRELKQSYKSEFTSVKREIKSLLDELEKIKKRFPPLVDKKKNTL